MGTKSLIIVAVLLFSVVLVQPWMLLAIASLTDWKTEKYFGETDITSLKPRATFFDRVTIPSGTHPGNVE